MCQSSVGVGFLANFRPHGVTDGIRAPTFTTRAVCGCVRVAVHGIGRVSRSIAGQNVTPLTFSYPF